MMMIMMIVVAGSRGRDRINQSNTTLRVRAMVTSNCEDFGDHLGEGYGEQQFEGYGQQQ